MQNNPIITLLQEGLNIPTNVKIRHAIDWAKLYQQASRQGVAAIAWDGLQRMIEDGAIEAEQLPDRATKLRWAMSVEQTEKRYAKQLRVIDKLATTLADQDIKIMILKGYGLSLCYPTPRHRACSDVDIWLYGKQHEADMLLHTSFGINIDNGKHHHTVFYIDGVMVENHFDFLNLHAQHSNRDIERELLRRTEEASQKISLENSAIYIPPVNLHALFLLRHAASHFAAVEIVLRHLIDWAMFVKHNAKDIDWRWLYDVCRKHKMDKFVDALNAYAVDLFGVDRYLIPEIARRPDIESRILHDILDPEFKDTKPEHGTLRIVWFKARRWWANRWKHRLVYNDGLVKSFATQSWGHILKPKSIKR